MVTKLEFQAVSHISIDVYFELDEMCFRMLAFGNLTVVGCRSSSMLETCLAPINFVLLTLVLKK